MTFITFIKSLLEKFKKSQYLTTALIILVLLVAGVGYYFYNQYRNAQSILKNPNLVVEKQTKELVDKVSLLMVLPKETPTIATVTDITKLKNQPFFANAKNGDKVLIYTTARKAILYDPVANKIVDVEPVSINNNNVQPQQPQTISPTIVAPKPTVEPTATIAPSAEPTK